MVIPQHTFPLGEVVGIAACLLASAFFSGSETALTRISSSRAEHLVESAPDRYGILKVWLSGRKRILAALLVGNNLVNIMCSILAYRVAIHFLPSYAEAISVFGLTLVILIFAEITPKSLALHWAERIAVPVLRIVWLVDKILWPLAWPLSRIPGLILGGADAPDDEPVVTEDEIEFHIRRGLDKSVFEEKAQGELLMSAVEFSDIMVKEVMVPRTDIFGLELETTMDEAADKAIESGHSRIPVYAENLDNIVGLLYAKDLLRHVRAESDGARTVKDVVRSEPFFVPETQRIRVLLGDMRHRGLHMAIVVDEFGGTAGLVTLEDVIEELVGEIRDEFDIEEARVNQIEEGAWQVDARLSLLDLKDEVGIDLPDSGDYESVGGYVIAQHGRIPRRGHSVSAPGVEIAVIESDRTRIKRLEIRKVEADPEGSDDEQ